MTAVLVLFWYNFLCVLAENRVRDSDGDQGILHDEIFRS